MLGSTGRKEGLHVIRSYLTIEKEEDFILFHAYEKHSLLGEGSVNDNTGWFPKVQQEVPEGGIRASSWATLSSVLIHWRDFPLSLPSSSPCSLLLSFLDCWFHLFPAQMFPHKLRFISLSPMMKWLMSPCLVNGKKESGKAQLDSFLFIFLMAEGSLLCSSL